MGLQNVYSIIIYKYESVPDESSAAAVDHKC